jgi:ribose/xylose/arabinose/galactoside ABC-type transport system permease subunit
VWWAFPVAIVSGAAMGLINGLLVSKVRINAFLATRRLTRLCMTIMRYTEPAVGDPGAPGGG